MILFDGELFLKSIPSLLEHVPITLFVAFFSFFLAMALGLVTALVKIYKVPVLKRLAGAYISFIRGTPLLVQLYIVAYGIPKFLYYFQSEYGMFQGLNPSLIPAMFFALFAFSINSGAYNAELIRSSIEAVGIGQFEAARSVGMTQVQALRRIILPQAFAIALPNLGNTVIGGLKETSFIFTIGIIDLMGQAKIIGGRAYAFLEVYVAVALIYWGVCIILEKLFARIERHMKKFERNIA
jgi:L-cystine transport system permease protein